MAAPECRAGSELVVRVEEASGGVLLVSLSVGERDFSGVLMDVSGRTGLRGMPVSVFPKREPHNAYPGEQENLHAQLDLKPPPLQLLHPENNGKVAPAPPVVKTECENGGAFFPLYSKGAPYPPPLLIRHTYNQCVPQPPPRTIKRAKRGAGGSRDGSGAEPESTEGLRPRRVLCERCQRVVSRDGAGAGATVPSLRFPGDGGGRKRRADGSPCDRRDGSPEAGGGRPSASSQGCVLGVPPRQTVFGRSRALRVPARVGHAARALGSRRCLPADKLEQARARDALRQSKGKGKRRTRRHCAESRAGTRTLRPDGARENGCRADTDSDGASVVSSQGSAARAGVRTAPHRAVRDHHVKSCCKQEEEAAATAQLGDSASGASSSGSPTSRSSTSTAHGACVGPEVVMAASPAASPGASPAPSPAMPPGTAAPAAVPATCGVDANGPDGGSWPVRHGGRRRRARAARVHKKSVTRCVTPQGKVVCVGDIVWAKLHGCPWWPAQVRSVSVSVQEESGLVLSQEAKMAWFGSTTTSFLPLSQAVPFMENFEARYSRRKKSNGYRRAVSEAAEASRRLTPEVRKLLTQFET
ncbi:PWWP domain-containing protein 2A-like isoform X2 [Petromyzon marinus]|uniref:PWWP domain-containing protein 2A-like isoform X2 n=2 Tax=Petromyzon marinus TaxID=7757 RepID=A0AAJ7X7P3_PETMA|nr:PWWP domain-containing protein 2A-like isoform X2 [Petromyzon marinus]